MAKTTIPGWIAKSEALLTAVTKESVQTLAREANKSRFKGGKMPIDTGFLTNSMMAKIGSLPSGASVKPENYNRMEWDSGPVTLVINSMGAGDTIFIGWTAEYARFMENRFGFMRSASQRWPEFVDESVMQLRALK